MKGHIIDALRRPGFSRRDFNRMLGAAGLSLAAMPILSKPSAAAGDLTFYTWSGYDVPEICPKYVAKYGGPPDFAIFASEEEALQKMLGGYNVDLAHPCHYNIKRWKDGKAIQAFDASRIPEYNNIWERFRTIPNTSFDGKPYFIPWDAGTSSIVYRTDLVDPADVADPSWALLFNEKYKGRLSMYDTDTTFIEIAARISGMYADYQHLSDEQLAKLKPLLVKQKSLMPYYWSDNTQIENGIASGELVAAYAWSGSYATLKSQGVAVNYMTPKEGILGYSCGLVRGANPPGSEDAAYDLINAMLDPEVGKFLMEVQGYYHSNAKSYELVSKETLANMGIEDPAKTFSALALDPEPEEPYRSKYIQFITEIKAGSS
ncbi:MAG TPA: extracellular solute-binding protein [Verrucomicrobiae bacterium]|nr:extracellular solute-binding protein [Verrucomicrobiae bacterium]